MKYLIVKGGPCGFGDRLECLKMYIRFAIKKNLKIYVDWVDPIWSHNGESFYTYFDLVNIPKLNSIDDIPADATVYPPIWKDKLKLPYTKDMKELSISDYLIDQEYNADVIVCSSVGYRYRYGDSSFFANVFRVIDKRIISRVRELQKKYDLKTKIGVHLRGTDRAARIDKSYRMSGLNIRMVSSGMLNNTKFIAVSDDIEYISTWKSRYPGFPILSEIKVSGGNAGTHNLSKNNIDISKDILNVDLLVDFFTLASCKSIISTSNDSRFAGEARILNKYLDKILS
jgi:hypothetical protein